MQIVAGVDGGGTYTRVTLASTDGEILGRGKAGPSNYGSVPKEKIIKHIESAIQEAWSEAELSPQKLDAIFLGMAGVVSSSDREVIETLIKESTVIDTKAIDVDHDIRISLAGGLAGKEGIALIVGTGSSCYGRTKDGKDWMAGGWGHLLDDRGSAYDLGRMGLISMIRAKDGRGPETTLTDLLLKKLEITDVKEIMHRVYVEGPSGKPMDKREIAALASAVTHAAEQGDSVAINIIDEGMSELVIMVKAVSDELNFTNQPVPVVTSGGTVSGSALMKERLLKKLQEEVPEVEVQESKLSPLRGSVLLALMMTGLQPTESIIQNLAGAK